MARPETHNKVAKKAAAAPPSAAKKVAPVQKAVVKKVAARASAASTKLEDRAVPSGHVRSRGVKVLLAERQARKR